ncbi:hypothetical protein [Humibacter ginsenosidimutans]|uniref:Phage gp6-like head-tail connector protein n=1 Tax=Humibacter ginsenosidimutans TaxID=2599293 RepID=A0A5B8M4P7_9MICO|nr:hypothetical protein [Humibacter ginsenosidimutans]QDZ14765.1 hypothetical protein FPZ11_08340 [Humibacter ginsenosidimutans]
MATTITWYTTEPQEQVERLEAAWPEAPVENLDLLAMILDVAQTQVLAFAPAPPDGEDWEAAPPARLVYAQLQQTINLWNAGSASPTGDVGPEGFSFTPRPLDKTIRTIIRPIDGKPDVL